MSVHLSRTVKLQIDSSFFVSRWNRAIFRPSVLHMALYKTLFLDFWSRPPNTENLLPKIWHKIACKSTCMANRPEMFAPIRGLAGMADLMEPCKMSGRPLLPWQRNLGKSGLLLHKFAYKSAFMTDRPISGDVRSMPTVETEQGNRSQIKQESCAIVKMTVQCALYMGVLKIFGTPWLRPRLLFPTFFMGFCSDRPYECSYIIWSP